MKKTRTTRATERLTVLVHIDPQAGAVYVQIRQGLKVARTEIKTEWPLFAVDYATDGRIIGIESAGAKEFSLGFMFKEAGIRVPARALQEAVFSTAA